MSNPEENQKNMERIEKEKKISSTILASTQKAVLGEAGLTSSWRTEQPFIDNEKCIVVKKQKEVCHFCWMYCPEATIKKTIPIEIDYDYCKGCGICAHECPHDAISMIDERQEESYDGP